MMLYPKCGYFNEERNDEYAPPYGFYEKFIDKWNSIPNQYHIYANEFPWGSRCDKCPNNSKNGGSGICNCILCLPKIK